MLMLVFLFSLMENSGTEKVLLLMSEKNVLSLMNATPYYLQLFSPK